MHMRQRQLGMSALGILAIMLMVGFFVMCTIRMVPPFLEYLSVKDIISKIAMEYDPDEENVADARRKIANVFNSNQIYLLDPRDVEVFNRLGKTYIDANYEVRLPILWRIDAVLKFDDLLYEVGNPRPLQNAPPPEPDQ